MNTYLTVYLGSLLLAVLVTPGVIWLARRIGAVDRPGIRTVHTLPIPRLGGVAIFVSAMALIISVIFVNNHIGAAFRAVQLPLLALLGSASLIFVVGLVDDLKGLPARIKFLAELQAALVLCLVGVRISDIAFTDQWVLPLGEWGWLLTILWVVGITNAVNLSDGLDGLAAGVSAIACGVIAVFAIHSGQVIMGVLMLALLGSLSGFLFFNFNPAKIFMGDCGSLFLGFTIAAASVMCMTKSAALVGLALPILALGVPIFDTLLSMLRRFLERRSLFAPDRSHFHHKLLDLGLQQRHAVLAIYLVTLSATGLGLFMMLSGSISSLVIFGCLLLLLVLLFRMVGAVHLHETVTALQEKYACSRRERQERKTFEHLQLQFRLVQDRRQWWQAICDAAQRMDFAWISLKTSYADGRIEEELWRAPRTNPDLSRIILMTIPLTHDTDRGASGGGDTRRVAGVPPACAEGLRPSHRRRDAFDTRGQDARDTTSRATAGRFRQCQFEIAICANGSVESAARRATLFGRLLDEGEARHAASVGRHA
jgi:UDP-GlcNAc:undecaprenyl-phosphate GlcNAc-1-phosphate transferase